MTLVTLTTDFGLHDPFVGVMKGVILGRAPAAMIVDLTHGIPPQDVLAGALVLKHSVPYFPSGTIHVAVVDPGVGTERAALCVETERGFLVGPDNGVLSLAVHEIRRIVHLTDDRFLLSPRSATFHGRDVFAPVAAALAGGTPASALGPDARDLKRLEVPAVTREGATIHGQVIYVDRFGNLVTNVSEADVAQLRREVVPIRIGVERLQGIAHCYGDVRTGEAVAVIGSWGLLEIAVRDGSARERLRAGVGEPIVIQA